MKRIKVFTTSSDGWAAGVNLTEQCDEFFKKNYAADIISVHTNSNKYGWMLTVVYE